MEPDFYEVDYADRGLYNGYDSSMHRTLEEAQLYLELRAVQNAEVQRVTGLDVEEYEIYPMYFLNPKEIIAKHTHILELNTQSDSASTFNVDTEWNRKNLVLFINCQCTNCHQVLSKHLGYENHKCPIPATLTNPSIPKELSYYLTT